MGKSEQFPARARASDRAEKKFPRLVPGNHTETERATRASEAAPGTTAPATRYGSLRLLFVAPPPSLPRRPLSPFPELALSS